MRRIKKAKIAYISLVPKGANGFPVLYKSDCEEAEFRTLLKASDDFDERGELTAVVFAPEIRDRQGDIASSGVVKQMAYDFQRDGGQIDIRHDGKAVGTDRAYVAENFLIQKGDPRFQDMKDYEGKDVDVTGGWGMVIKIEDPDLRTQYRDGKWNGVSMAGPAELEPDDVNKSDLSYLVDEFSKLIKGEIDMDKKEMAELLKESNEDLAKTLSTSIADSLKGLTKKEEPEKDDVKKVDIEFEGDPTDPDDLKAHLAKIELAKLDMNDPNDIVKLIKRLEKDDGDDVDLDDDPKVARLQKQMKRIEKKLQKAQGKSNQSGGSKDDEIVDPEQYLLSKEEHDCVEIGDSIAKYANAMLGSGKE